MPKINYQSSTRLKTGFAHMCTCHKNSVVCVSSAIRNLPCFSEVLVISQKNDASDQFSVKILCAALPGWILFTFVSPEDVSRVLIFFRKLFLSMYNARSYPMRLKPQDGSKLEPLLLRFPYFSSMFFHLCTAVLHSSISAVTRVIDA